MENNTNENNVADVRKVEGTINDMCFASDSGLTRENCWCAQCKEEVVLILKQQIQKLEEVLAETVADARKRSIDARGSFQRKQNELKEVLVRLIGDEELACSDAEEIASIFDVELTRTYKVCGTWEMEVTVPLSWKVRDVENSIDVDLCIGGDGDVETSAFEIDSVEETD
jgi:hypothetical protein